MWIKSSEDVMSYQIISKKSQARQMVPRKQKLMKYAEIVLNGNVMKLHDFIKEKLREVVEAHSGREDTENTAFYFLTGGMSLGIDMEGLRLIYETGKEIIKEREVIKNHFSHRFIEDELRDIVFLRYHYPTTNLNNILVQDAKDLLNYLERTPLQRWVFFIPITNLKMMVRSFTLGNVGFYNMSQSMMRRLESKYKMRLGIGNSLDERYSRIIKETRTTTFSTVTVSAGEVIKAREKAFEEVDAALNVLRLYGPTERIGTHGEVFTPFRNIYHMNLTTKSYGEDVSRVDFPVPFTMDDSRLSLLRKKGCYGRFSKLLKNNTPTDLERKILTSIHWYGLGIKDTNQLDKFVKLVIALESILLNEREEPKRYHLAERAALILGKGKEKKRIYDRVHELYGIRSKIVHEGSKDVKAEDVDDLFYFLSNLVFFMIKNSHKFKSLNDVIEWINELKFS